MKKTSVLILIMAFCVCFLASCSLFHEHTFEGWNSDENFHYEIVSCSWNTCDIEQYVEEHSFVGDVCSVCGYRYGYDITVSYAGVRTSLAISGLNSDKLSISSVRHLPIYKLDTASDLDGFKQSLGETTLGDAYDEIPSFNFVTSKYDEAFFDQNTLMIVYVSATSGSYRYGVNNIYFDGTSLCIHVEQTNAPSVLTDDMTGWFITVAIPDALLSECTEFDADLNNIECRV